MKQQAINKKQKGIKLMINPTRQNEQQGKEKAKWDKIPENNDRVLTSKREIEVCKECRCPIPHLHKHKTHIYCLRKVRQVTSKSNLAPGISH